MSDALKAATEDLRLLCDLYENGSPITMSAAQFVAESGRTILAALRERDAEHVAALQQAIAAEREACLGDCNEVLNAAARANDAHAYAAARLIVAAIRARGKEAGDAASE